MKLIIFLFLFSLSPTLFAQELETGKVYASGAKVTSKMLGISLKIPKGWKGGISGQYFVVAKEGVNGLVAVSAEQATLAEVEAFLSAPQQLHDGYVFAPNGKPSTVGKTVSVPCVIAQGLEKWNGEFTVRVGKHGVAVGVIAAGADDALPTLKKTGKTVAKSIGFKKPYVPKPGKSSGPYAKQLKNIRLYLFNTTSTTSSRKTITLCGDGSFTWDSESSGATDQGPGDTVAVSFAGQSNYHGKYSVVGNQLHLFYSDGDKSEYDLSTNAEDHFLMNGTRWLREAANCQ